CALTLHDLRLLCSAPAATASNTFSLHDALPIWRQELWPLQGRIRRLLDRLGEQPHRVQSEALAALTAAERRVARLAADGLTNRQDRKSTRLNSSHVKISYAVFCLKKKNETTSAV